MDPRALPLIALAAACLAVPVAAQQPGDSAVYTILMSGNRAGVEVDRRTKDGGLAIHYEFNDRGRGPGIDENLTLGAGGVPTAISIDGHDYMKNAVNERFSVVAGAPTWKNSAEAGSAAAGARGFYLSMDGASGEAALLARALLAAPGRSLDLLPTGRAHIDSIESLTVQANGATRTVIHYDVSGLGFSPQPIWLDPDGTLFAMGSTWYMIIRAGWEPAAGAIVDRQRAADQARAGVLSAKLSRRPKGVVAFRNAELFDAVSGKIVPGTTVIVDRDRIVAVGPTASTPVPAGAEVIDATGKTLMPGMWDMHVHLQDDDGLFNIAAGITTVRDLANDIDESLARQRRFADGSLIGPRLLLAGFIDGPGPYAGPTKVLVATEDSARNAVRNYAKLGYVQIKIYSSVKPELVPAIIDEAHKHGLRVSGHIPAFMTAEQAVKEGYDEIQHANFLFLNFWFDSVPDTQTPARFVAVAQKAATLDLKSPAVQQFVALLKSHGTVLDPTVNVFEEMFVARKGSVNPVYAPIADRMPPTIRRGFLTGGLPVPAGMDQRYRDSFKAALAMVKMMHDAGVPILAGTDAFAGFAYQRELELYVQAGIPAPDVLRIATLGAARVMKLDRELGSVEKGKYADLVLIAGHPATTIGDIRHVALVMKNGVLFDPAALDSAVGVLPWKTP